MSAELSPKLVEWRKRLFVAAIVISALWLLAVVGPKSARPEQQFSLGISLIPLLLAWGTMLFLRIGLRAWSCILAALESMLYIASAGVILFTAGPLRLFGVVPLLFAVFFYLFSVKTWALHEEFWLRQAPKVEAGPTN